MPAEEVWAKVSAEGHYCKKFSTRDRVSPLRFGECSTVVSDDMFFAIWVPLG